MNKKTSLIILFLLLVVAYLAGSAIARIKYGESSTLGTNAEGPTPTGLATGPTTAPFVPTKSKLPEVKFFVMSFCPYGNQAEAGLEPVYQLLKDKVSWIPRYIVSKISQTTIDNCKASCPQRIFNDDAKQQCDVAIKNNQIKDMEECKLYFPYSTAEECITKECSVLKTGTYESLHGNQELNQNVREIVAFNLGNLTNWWKFVSLVNTSCTSANADTCWKDQAVAAGLDSAKIESQSKSQMTSLFDKEIAEVEKYQVQGSPTVIINGTVYNGGRTPEDYKKAICLAFDVQPAECSQVLGQQSSTIAAAAGNCH